MLYVCVAWRRETLSFAVSSSTTTAVFTLVGTLGGVALTGLIAGLRTVGDHRHEMRMKQLDVQLAGESSRRADRRQSYEEFLVATDGAYQLAADLYARSRSGERLDFRTETRDVVAELMRHELSVALVGTTAVRKNAREYVGALRMLLIASVQGQWSDVTKQQRNQLYASMIADINPGNEPVEEQPPPVKQQPVPPRATGDK